MMFGFLSLYFRVPLSISQFENTLLQTLFFFFFNSSNYTSFTVEFAQGSVLRVVLSA